MTRKILTLFVILNIIVSQFYPVLVYAQGSGVPDYCKAEDFNGTPETAPECFPVEFEVPKPSISTDYTDIPESDPLLSQTPGILQGWDSINIGVNVKPVVDEKTQKRVVEKYDEDTRKWLKKDAEEAAAPRENEEKKSRDYTLANKILEQGGNINSGAGNPGEIAGRIWNGFTSAIAGIGAGIKSAFAPDEETRQAQQAVEEAKKEVERESGGERIQKAERRLADLAAALASVNAEEKAKIVQAFGLGADATDADLYVKFNENKGLAIQGDPGSGSFVITTPYGGYSVRQLYESPGYAGWSKKEAVQRIEKTGEIVADLGTMGLYSAVKRFPELKEQVLPKVVEACSSTVDTNSNGFRILVGEYQGIQSGKICDPNLPDITSCTPGFTNAEKEEAKTAAAQIKASKDCHDAFTDYAELMADAYAGITGAALNFVDTISVVGATIKVIKVTTRGANAAARLTKGAAQVAKEAKAIKAVEEIKQAVVSGVKQAKNENLEKIFVEDLAKDPNAYLEDFMKNALINEGGYSEEAAQEAIVKIKAEASKLEREIGVTAGGVGTGGVRRFEPADVADSIAPRAGERAAEAVRRAERIPGKTAAELAQQEIEEEGQNALKVIADIETGRVAREAAQEAVERAVKDGAEKAAAEAAAEAVGEAIARVGGKELVPNNPVSKAAAWVQDTVGGLFGGKAKQEAAGLTRGEAAKAIEDAADDAARLVKEGRPVEEAVAKAVDDNLGKALGEIVDGEAEAAGEKAAQAIAEQGIDAAARVAQEKTEEIVADVGGRIVGIPEIAGVAPPNPVTRAMRSVTDSAKGAYDSTIGRVFERKGKEIGKERGEQVARDARDAAEVAIPVEAPQGVVRGEPEAKGGGIFGLFKKKPKDVGEDVRDVTTGAENSVDNTLDRLTGRGGPEPPARIQPTREPIAQRTVASLKRGGVNEDRVLASNGEGVIAVFDGAGGHASGEVASGIAKSTYESVLFRELPENPSEREVLIALRTAHDRAIESMGAFARANPASHEMGTTSTVVKVFEEEGERKAAVLSMGDTRAYVVTKNGRVHQVTQDEGALENEVINGRMTPQKAREIQRRLDEVTDVSQLSREEAYYYEKRNATNLLGPDRPSTPRVEVFRLGEDVDYIFIASDGIHDNLTASRIEAIVRSARNPQEAVDNLVNAARETAGRQLNSRAKDDDLTAVAIDVSNRGRGNPQGIITSPAQALKNPERPVYVGAAQEQTRFGGIKVEINPPSVIDRKAYQHASEIAKKFIADPGHDEITAVAIAIERGLSESEISDAYKRVSEAIENLKARIKVTSYEIHEAEVVRHPERGTVEEIIRPTGKKGERVEFDYFGLLNDTEVGRLMDDLIFETGDVESVKRISAAMKSLERSETGRAIDLDQLHRDIESSLVAPFFKAALTRESTLKEAVPLIEQSKRAVEVLRDFCLNNGVLTTSLLNFSNCMRYFPDKIFEISNVHIVSPEALQKLCRRSGIVGCYESALKKIMVLRGQGKQTYIHECTHKYCALVATERTGELGDLLRSRRKDIKPAAGQAATDSLYYYLTRNENKLIEGLTEFATQKAIRLLGEKASGVAYPEAVNLIEKRVIPTIMKNSNRTREQAEAIAIEAAFGNYEKLFLEIGAGSKERGAEILTTILDEWVPRTPNELQGLRKLLAAMKVVAIGTVGVGGDVALDQATESLLDNYLNKPASSEPERNSSPNPSKLLPFSGIKEVLAAGETTGQPGYFIDSNALEFTAKKEMAKNSLSGGQGATSEDLGQILKTEVISSETFRVQGGYIVTTGKSGVGEGFIDPGKYIVEVGAIPGVDIKIPGVVEVKDGQETVIPVAVKEGSGKAEKLGYIHEDDGLLKKAYAQETRADEKTGKVTVVVFADKNNNGKFDKNEKILPWAGLTVELKKVSQEQVISLNEGDNAFTLPVLPGTPLTASLLLREITLQDGDAISVSTLENGAWKTYVAEGAKAYSFEDFPILPEKLYSIKSRRNSTFLIKGQEFITPGSRVVAVKPSLF